MLLKDCVAKAQFELRAIVLSGDHRHVSHNSRPEIRVYTKNSDMIPELTGTFVACDDNGIVIETMEAMIRYLPRETQVEICNYPLTINFLIHGMAASYTTNALAVISIKHRGVNDWYIASRK